MNYTKPLKSFSATTLTGFEVSASDSGNERDGSVAVEAFEAHKTVSAKAGDNKVLVPFHAIKMAGVATTTEDAEKADPYCGGGD